MCTFKPFPRKKKKQNWRKSSKLVPLKLFLKKNMVSWVDYSFSGFLPVLCISDFFFALSLRVILILLYLERDFDFKIFFTSYAKQCSSNGFFSFYGFWAMLVRGESFLIFFQWSLLEGDFGSNLSFRGGL